MIYRLLVSVSRSVSGPGYASPSLLHFTGPLSIHKPPLGNISSTITTRSLKMPLHHGHHQQHSPLDAIPVPSMLLAFHHHRQSFIHLSANHSFDMHTTNSLASMSLTSSLAIYRLCRSFAVFSDSTRHLLLQLRSP